MRKFVLSFVLLLTSLLVLSPVVNAQQQDFNFSGNSADSYQCYDLKGNLLNVTPTYDSAAGEFYCIASDGSRIKAVLKPPSLQELEVLFVKVVYYIWALVATFSFIMVIYLAYQYLISRGDATQVKAIRERIIKFIIGFALVFLAVPILVTFFKLLGVRDQVSCYQGLTGSDNNIGIGFQFFFADLCTDPNNKIFETCSNTASPTLDQSVVNQITSTPCSSTTPKYCYTSNMSYEFTCSTNSIWRLSRVSPL